MCQVYVDEVIPIRPVLLVHEPQSMEEFVHQQQQAVLWGEALGVQENALLPLSYHTQIALAARSSRMDRHKVEGGCCFWSEGDARHLLLHIVHRLLHKLLMRPAKSLVKMRHISFMTNYIGMVL